MVGKTVLSLTKMEMIMIRANQIIEIKIQSGMEPKNCRRAWIRYHKGTKKEKNANKEVKIIRNTLGA